MTEEQLARLRDACGPYTWAAARQKDLHALLAAYDAAQARLAGIDRALAEYREAFDELPRAWTRAEGVEADSRLRQAEGALLRACGAEE